MPTKVMQTITILPDNIQFNEKEERAKCQKPIKGELTYHKKQANQTWTDFKMIFDGIQETLQENYKKDLEMLPCEDILQEVKKKYTWKYN